MTYLSTGASAHVYTFHNTVLNIVDQDGQPWLRAQDIGQALGYLDPKAIHRIYKRNASEFPESMTGVVNLTTPSGVQETRIFNLRGAHLLGMFARTSVASEFRRWVLDILEKENDPKRGSAQRWIDPQRKLHLRRLVEHRANYLKCSTQKIWGEVRFVTGAGSIHDFTQAEYEEAVAYLGGFPIRGRQAERFPVPVTQAEINNFRSFMQVFRAVVDEAGFLREVSKSLGSSKLLSLWSLIDSANFMSGTAECIEARLIGVGMESSPSLRA